MDIVSVSVVLSTTRHSIADNSDKLAELNTPVCIAVVKLSAPVQKIKKQKIKQSCRELAEYVHIDPEKKTVWVGLRNINSDTYLIEYNIENSPELGEEFIERWIKTKMLIFEFSIYDKKDKFILSLKGLWDGFFSRWSSLEFLKYRSIVSTDRGKHETFISKGTL